MQKFRILLAICGFILFVCYLVFILDYTDLSWSNNLGSYIGITSSWLLIFSGMSSYFYDRKKVREEGLQKSKK